MSESRKNTPSASSSFVDCGEANIKLEIKEEEEGTLDCGEDNIKHEEEEYLDEDPLYVKMDSDNVEEKRVKLEFRLKILYLVNRNLIRTE